MRPNPFHDASQPRGVGYSLLHDRLVQVVPRRRPETQIPADARRRKHELPPPLSRRRGELAIQRTRQDNPPEPARQIRLMDPPHIGEVYRQRLPRRRGKHRHPVFSPLPLPHDDLMAIEIEIFDPKRETLLQPEPRAVEQRDDEPRRTRERLQQRRHLVPAEHDRPPLRRARSHNRWNATDLDREHSLVEKQHGAEAWFCVEALTCWCSASQLRNAERSAAPNAAGWTLP